VRHVAIATFNINPRISIAASFLTSTGTRSSRNVTFSVFPRNENRRQQRRREFMQPSCATAGLYMHWEVLGLFSRSGWSGNHVDNFFIRMVRIYADRKVPNVYRIW